jgi:hypothetical protein
MRRAEEQTQSCSAPIKQFAKVLARFEEGNSLRWHFDSGFGSWIAPDATWSLARVKLPNPRISTLAPDRRARTMASVIAVGGKHGFVRVRRQLGGERRPADGRAIDAGQGAWRIRSECYFDKGRPVSPAKQAVDLGLSGSLVWAAAR